MMYEYEREAAEWLYWVERATHQMDDHQLPTNLGELRRLEYELERFKSEDLPPKAREKQRLADHYAELHQLFERTEHLHIPTELNTESLDRSWQRLLRSLSERFSLIEEQARVQVFEDANMWTFANLFLLFAIHLFCLLFYHFHLFTFCLSISKRCKKLNVFTLTNFPLNNIILK